MIAKKWLLQYIILSIPFCLMIILFNYYDDSYSIFRKDYSKLVREPNQNFVKMNFLIKGKHNFNSFIFGSSRVGHIDPTDIVNGNYYNMTYSEGLPAEHLSNIKLLLKSNIKIKNILIGLDDFSYEVNPLLHKQQPMRQSHYLTDFNSMPEWRFYIYYLLKRPSFFIINRVIKQTVLNVESPTEDYDIYKTGLPLVPKRIEEKIENNITHHINDKKFMKPCHYAGNRIDATINDIKSIVKLSKQYHFNLIFFINPIHHTTYLDTNFNNFQLFKRKLVDVTDYYDFSGLNSITTNNYYYYETSHFRNKTGDLIKERIFNNKLIQVPKDFGVYVNKDNIKSHLENLKKQIENNFSKSHLQIQ